METAQLTKISELLSIPADKLLVLSMQSYLREQKRVLMIERLEYLRRYGVSQREDIKRKIENGDIPDHPAWEDFIEVSNVEEEIRRIEDALNNLSSP
ncbi:hypothetical protein HYR99_06455 [Candidatus Poribacteria bacterium]|nr:hypothetical protein [Candidatus Poribacteria bacterium]